MASFSRFIRSLRARKGLAIVSQWRNRNAQFSAAVRKQDGWLVPRNDQGGLRHLAKDVPSIEHLLSFVPERDVVVQAGGNVGIWPARYAQEFKSVYTFEPDPMNFRCLVHNATAPNIYYFNSALGERHGLAAIIERNPFNVGANAIDFSSGAIPVMMIDDLCLPKCDLIHLDIEGCEASAIRGGQNTIRECKPVIAVEMREHNKHDVIENLLLSFGYRYVGDAVNDKIFIADQ